MKPKINLIKCDKKLKIKVNRSKRKNNFCSECHLQFGNNTVFRLHQKLVHMPEIRIGKKLNHTRNSSVSVLFPCTQCTERFSSIMTFEMHFRFCHADILLKEQLHKFKCQEIVVNTLKLQICKLKQKETERERHISLLTDKHANEVRNLKNTVRDWESSQKCKICTEKQIEAAFMTCGHCICCNECAAKIKECPICRSEIFTTMQIKL